MFLEHKMHPSLATIAISTKAITHGHTKDGYLIVLVHNVAPHFLTRGGALHTSSMMWYLHDLHMMWYLHNLHFLISCEIPHRLI